jgi:GAF domain-containing protein/HAMP domain-containing protein
MIKQLFHFRDNTTPKTARNLTTTLAIAFFGLSALTLLIYSGVQIILNIQTQQVNISDREQLIAQNAANTVSSFIEEKFTELSVTVWQANPYLASSDGQTRILTSIMARQLAFRQLAIFDAQKNATALASRLQTNSSAASAIFTGRITSELLDETQKGRSYISSAYFDEVNDEPLVIMAVPMIDALGNFQGTLVAELNLISIWRLVNQLKVGETGYAYVVDRQGTLIAFSDTSRVLNQENESGIKSVDVYMQNPSPVNAAGVNVYQGIKGTRVVGTYAALETPDWAVVIELPWNEAYQDIIRDIEVSIGSILTIAILAGLTGVLVARGLAQPLVILTETASRIASGEMELQAKVGGAKEVATLATAFNSMTVELRNLIGSLEQRVTERTAELTQRSHDLEQANEHAERRARQLQAVSEVARAIASVQNLHELLPRIAELVSERFGFYHVGIFLLDGMHEYAILSATNSEGGQRMLARSHKLKVGEVGIVGFVGNTGQPRIALDTGADSVFFNNPDLPETRSEMALPLKVGDQIIGVLDVQSTESGAFTAEDIEVLGTLADQVSIAIENARLFEETRRSLTESENLYREYLRQEWKAITRERQHIGYHYTITGFAPLDRPIEWPEIKKTLATGRMQVEFKLNEPAKLAVPIKLRGEMIGVLDIRSPASRDWDQDEIDIAQAIAERVALAVENARLLEDSQRRANKERTISEITSKISTSINMRNVLQTAVDELGKAIPGSDIVIQFQQGNNSDTSKN